MPARDLSKHLKINNPCSANWDQRSKRVLDSANTPLPSTTQPSHQNASNADADSKGRLCVVYRVAAKAYHLRLANHGTDTQDFENRRGASPQC